MRIVIDNRERELIKLLTELCATYNASNASTKKGFEPVAFEVNALDLGDAILQRPDGTCAYIYERKTLADLAASIVDGRHKSQNLRLISAQTTDNAQIRLICEIPKTKRDFMNLTCDANPFPGTRIIASALRSAVINGEMRDSIFPCWTENTADTAMFLLGRIVYAKRLVAECAVPPRFAVSPPPPQTNITDNSGCNNNGTNGSGIDHLPTDNDGAAERALSVVVHHRKKKSDNCTAETCFADMLNAMSGVGLKRAVDIAAHFGNMKNLVDKLTAVTTKKQIVEVFKPVAGVGPTTAENVYEGVFGARFAVSS